MASVAVITRTTATRPLLIQRAVRSVLQQSHTDWLHVFANDGGDPDALANILQPFEADYAGRLRVLNLPHAGMQAAANSAIAQSVSTFIAIHDDDDAWDPHFLSETTRLLDAAGPDSAYQGAISQTLRVLERENPDGSLTEVSRTPYVPLQHITLDRIGYENPFPPIAFLFRRSAFEAIGPFDPHWDIAADLDFNFRFLQRFNIGVVHKPLALYFWREAASQNASQNTVTARKADHARLFADLKNHYLRNCQSPQQAVFALAFLISHFAVENQWMTAQVREHSAFALQHLTDLKATLAELLQFQHSALWPKLTEDILPALNLHSHNLGGFANAIDALQAAVDALHKDLSQLAADTAHGNAAVDALHKDLSQLAADTAHGNAAVDALHKDLSQLAADTAHGNAAVDALHKDLSQLAADTAHGNAAVAALHKDLSQLAADTTHGNATVDALHRELHAVAAALPDFAAQHSETLALLATLRAHADDAEARHAHSQAELSTQQAALAASVQQQSAELEALHAHQQARKVFFKLGPLEFAWQRNPQR